MHVQVPIWAYYGVNLGKPKWKTIVNAHMVIIWEQPGEPKWEINVNTRMGKPNWETNVNAHMGLLWDKPGRTQMGNI